MQLLIENWRDYYDHDHPHGALGHCTLAKALTVRTDKVGLETPHKWGSGQPTIYRFAEFHLTS